MVIGFIGTGHMGSAIAKAVAKSVPGETLLLSDLCAESAEKVKNALTALRAGLPDAGTVSVVSSKEAAEAADYLFLAVKPQNMAEMLTDLQEVFRKRRGQNSRFVLVSMAAGVESGRIQALSGASDPVIRIMPNTPVELEKGVIAYAGSRTTEEELKTFTKMLEKAGLLLPLPEEKMDAVCALSGSGPAYVYVFIDSLKKAGVSLGLSDEEALQMALKTIDGALAMVSAGKGTPEALANAVCSPGGTTIEGMKVLKAAGFDKIVENTLKAAYQRALELKN